MTQYQKTDLWLAIRMIVYIAFLVAFPQVALVLIYISFCAVFCLGLLRFI